MTILKFLNKELHAIALFPYYLSKFMDLYSFFAVLFVPICLIVGDILSQKYYSNNELKQYDVLVISSMNSTDFKYVVVVEMTIAILLLLDVFIYHLSKMRNMFTTKGSLINILILLALLIASFINFYVSIPSQDYQLMYRLFQTRMVLIFCSILSYAYRYGRSVWRSRYLAIITLIGNVGTVLRIATMAQYDANSSTAGFLGILSMIGQITFAAMLCLTCIRWFHHIKKEKEIREITVDEWSCTIYVTLGLLTAIIVYTMVILFGAPLVRDFSVSYLISIEVAFTSFVVAQAFHQTHVIRKQSVKYQEELEFKRMFVRYISHEVRTPLNTAIMGLQLLYEELHDNIYQEQIDTVTDIRVSCDVAVNILNELLTFDKLEAGTLMVEKTSFNAMELIEGTVYPFQIQARKAGVTLDIVTECNITRDSRTRLLADRNKISQIIRNMVSNGLKFTPSGGSVNVLVNVVDVTAEDGKACKMLKIDVVDSGVGISPENQKRLFKEIVQFNPGELQKGGGSGLGLYISNGIANLHGGSLSVYSEGEGHGCTFTLILPCTYEDLQTSSHRLRRRIGRTSGIYGVQLNDSVRSVQSDALASFRTTTKTNNHQSVNDQNTNVNYLSPMVVSMSTGDEKTRDAEMAMASRPKAPEHHNHVLVVDDSAMSRKMQCRLLKKRCLSCIEAENGQEAVDKVKMAMTGGGDGINPIDLVIIDCNMPVMNGMVATKAMRNMGYEGIIVGLTGNVSVEDIEEFMSHGADVVLAKPLDMAKFDVALLNLVSRFTNECDEIEA